MKIGTGLKIALALAGVLGAGSTSAAALTQVPHNVPALVSKARFLRHHPSSVVMHISVALKLRDQGQLAAFLQQLQDPSSPNYHRFLSQPEFTKLYGPTLAQVQAVRTFLTRHGITVDSVSKGRSRMHAHASTAVLESAFGVAINDYSYAGRTFYAASTDPSMPAAVGSVVTAVMGLDDAVMLTPHSIFTARPAGSGVGPGGYSPTQIATAYGWPSLTDTAQAAGVTIGIVTAYTYRPADIAKFWKQYGLPSHSLQAVQIDGTTHRLDGETTLDIERSSSMSPGSAIKVYEAYQPFLFAFADAFQQVADDDDVDVVSTSWGSPESGAPDSTVKAHHAAFQQLAAEGIPVIAAAGDDGSADRTANVDVADFPSSDPYVTAAGGTRLALNPDDTIVSESAWTDVDNNGSAGGADSAWFAQPGYQTAVPGWAANAACDGDHIGDFPADTTDTPNEPGEGCTGAGAASRQSSDMSMDADPDTGYSIYYNGRWIQAGGTSFVAPELAGFFAIVVQRYRTSIGDSTAHIGSASNLIYQDAVANAADFNDITTGNNGNFSAGPGWDHPTGWGTPHNASTLADDLQNLLPH